MDAQTEFPGADQRFEGIFGNGRTNMSKRIQIPEDFLDYRFGKRRRVQAEDESSLSQSRKTQKRHGDREGGKPVVSLIDFTTAQLKERFLNPNTASDQDISQRGSEEIFAKIQDVDCLLDESLGYSSSDEQRQLETTQRVLASKRRLVSDAIPKDHSTGIFDFDFTDYVHSSSSEFIGFEDAVPGPMNLAKALGSPAREHITFDIEDSASLDSVLSITFDQNSVSTDQSSPSSSNCIDPRSVFFDPFEIPASSGGIEFHDGGFFDESSVKRTIGEHAADAPVMAHDMNYADQISPTQSSPTALALDCTSATSAAPPNSNITPTRPFQFSVEPLTPSKPPPSKLAATPTRILDERRVGRKLQYLLQYEDNESGSWIEERLLLKTLESSLLIRAWIAEKRDNQNRDILSDNAQQASAAGEEPKQEQRAADLVESVPESDSVPAPLLSNSNETLPSTTVPRPERILAERRVDRKFEYLILHHDTTEHWISERSLIKTSPPLIPKWKASKTKIEKQNISTPTPRNEQISLSYVVEKILDKRKFKGVSHYLVKWEGYERTEDRTWEPCERLGVDIPGMVEEYEMKRGKKTVKPAVKKRKRPG